MAKYYGEIGFGFQRETAPGVWEDKIVTRCYSGDILKSNRKLQTGNQLNDNIRVTNQISILADPYANDNIYAIRYASFQGTKWKVTDIDVQYPRLTFTLGGVYNENTCEFT